MKDRLPVVLHVVTDYPDGVNKVSTKAVLNLQDASSEKIKHKTVSIVREKRISFKVLARNDLWIIRTPRLPLGLFANTLFFITALLIYLKCKKEFKDVDVIHGHKLCMDGVIAYCLAKLLNKPLFTSVRGTTDYKWVKKKISSRWLYRAIARRSKSIFWVSLWPREFIKQKLRLGKMTNDRNGLPNICEVKPNTAKISKGGGKFLFVGRLDYAVSKGLVDVLNAISKGENISLDIVGSGDQSSTIFIHSIIEKLALDSRVNIIGAVEKSRLNNMYCDYTGLIMPSYPETFGMVYIEALLNTLPVIAAKNSGIYGYFNNVEYVEFVEYGDIDGIAKCMNRILDNEIELKSALKNDIRLGKLDGFLQQGVTCKYTAAVNGAISQ